MSTSGSSQPNGSSSKRRRIRGACDICKKRKIRCDSGKMLGNRCSNCLHFGLNCTHEAASKGSLPAKGYIESLETRLEKMELLLNKLQPGIDFNKEIDDLVEDANGPLEAFSLLREDDVTPQDLATTIQRLQLNPPNHRFYGKSSTYNLVQAVFDLRSEYTSKGVTIEPGRLLRNKRAEFWDIPPWRCPSPQIGEEHPPYVFPDEDLILTLVDDYFFHMNHFLPLLHRPTFEKCVADGLHKVDDLFGGTLLLVCAIGSRYSEDPRVLLDVSQIRSAGWKWFNQVPLIRRSFFNRTSLYELQLHALSVMFIYSTETPHGSWTQTGMALRLAQEVGAHRRRSQNTSPTGENELWKRAFWILLILDRLISSFSGCPCALHDEDFDVELPVECDDEYWECSDPSQDFQQPTDKPSTISFFNCYLKLMDILALGMRTVYCIKRPRNLLQQSDQQIIAELDSALNNWMDSVPNHLRWNANSKDQPFFDQSAVLYTVYYNLQIFIHRPFIPTPRNPKPSTFPSLAICTNAARSCCHVLEVQGTHCRLGLAHIQIAVFASAIILLLNIWSGKRSGFALNPRRELEDVQKCMKVLKDMERQWAAGGRFWDILSELASAGDLSFAEEAAKTGLSTPTQAEDHQDGVTDNDEFPQPVAPSGSSEAKSIADSYDTLRADFQSYYSDSPPNHGQPANVALPMYGNELGRLPIYGQFSFTDRATPTDAHLGGGSGSSNPYADYHLLDHGRFPSPDVRENGTFHPRREMLPQDIVQNPSLASSWSHPPNVTSRDLPTNNVAYSRQFVGMQPEASRNLFPVTEEDILNTWPTASAGYGLLNEWGTFITNVDQMTHGHNF